MSLWVIASVALKLCTYLTVASAIGSAFTLVLLRTGSERSGAGSVPGYRGTATLCALGLVVSGAYFLVRVGDFAGAGLAGMFDPLFVQILWESPVGDALRYRVAGFIILLLALAAAPALFAGGLIWPRWALAVLYGVAVLLLALTFSFTGHSSELGLVGSAAVTLHVLVALWWAGALYPLWCATRGLEPVALQRVLHRFGLIAGGLLLAMVLAGGLLLYLLLFVPEAAVTTAYAAAIIVKLATVALLFAIAAIHKWRTVPRLLQPGGVASFRYSLAVEMGLMVFVLALTSIFSTVIGPFAA